MTTEQTPAIINDGGCAFPFVCSDISKHQVHEAGMSLRTYIATKALQTLIHDWCEGDPKHADATAEAAVIFADALIKRLSKL